MSEENRCPATHPELGCGQCQGVVDHKRFEVDGIKFDHRGSKMRNGAPCDVGWNESSESKERRSISKTLARLVEQNVGILAALHEILREIRDKT